MHVTTRVNLMIQRPSQQKHTENQGREKKLLQPTELEKSHTQSMLNVSAERFSEKAACVLTVGYPVTFYYSVNPSFLWKQACKKQFNWESLGASCRMLRQ